MAWPFDVLSWIPLWVAARSRAHNTHLPTEPPTAAELAWQAHLAEAVESGQTFTLEGDTIEHPAIALGQVLARVESRREAPGSRHDVKWVSADESNEGVLSTVAYDFTSRQIHGWRDPRGRLHLHRDDSRHLLNVVTGDVGTELIVIYDRHSPRHFVFRVATGAGPVRSAARPAGPSPRPQPPKAAAKNFSRPPDPYRASPLILGGARPSSASWPPQPRDVPTPRPSVPEDDEVTRLYAAVAATPDDDTPRVALAEHYRQRGDRHGDFIALQLEIARSRTPPDMNQRATESALFRGHGQDWTPPGTREPRFHRGFLQHVEWFEPTDPRHPGWMTVESVHCALSARPPASAFDYARPLLKTVTGLNVDQLEELLSAAPPALEQLETEVPASWLLSGLDRVVKTFGRLRVLGLRVADPGSVTEDHVRSCLEQCAGLERLQVPRLPIGLDDLTRLHVFAAPRLRLEVAFPDKVSSFSCVYDVRTERLLTTSGLSNDLADELSAELGRTVAVDYRRSG